MPVKEELHLVLVDLHGIHSLHHLLDLYCIGADVMSCDRPEGHEGDLGLSKQVLSVCAGMHRSRFRSHSPIS